MDWTLRPHQAAVRKATMSTKSSHADWQQKWITSRVKGALDGLSIAGSSVSELAFEAARVGGTMSHSQRVALNEIESEIAALTSRLRALSPIEIPAER
jgi:hypothetical protein